MPDITIAAGGTAKQLTETSFDNARDGSGEGTGAQAHGYVTTGFGNEFLPAGTVLFRRDGQKVSGPAVNNQFTLLRYFMIFTIPSSTNEIAQASITLTSAGYATDTSGDARSFLSKGKFVAADIAGSSIVAGDYDSISPDSMTTYDDTSGIVISGTDGDSVTTNLNAAAISQLNTLGQGGGGAFELALIEYEHDYLDNGTPSFPGIQSAGGPYFSYDGFHIDEAGETNEPVLTISYGVPGGHIKLSSGMIQLNSGHTVLQETLF